MNVFEDDKMILKKEVFLSVLGWSFLSFVLVVAAQLAITYVLDGSFTLMAGESSSALLSSALPIHILVPILFGISLHKNKAWFSSYKFRMTYLTYIFIFFIVFYVVAHWLLYGLLEFPPNYVALSLVWVFIIAGLIKTPQTI